MSFVFQINVYFIKARKEAVREEKWLLVNLLHHNEFNCHLMNRDIWTDETLKQVVSSGYLLWQRGSESAGGKKFMLLYNICVPEFLVNPSVVSSLFPALFFIDPRTGALVKAIKVVMILK